MYTSEPGGHSRIGRDQETSAFAIDLLASFQRNADSALMRLWRLSRNSSGPSSAADSSPKFPLITDPTTESCHPRNHCTGVKPLIIDLSFFAITARIHASPTSISGNSVNKSITVCKSIHKCQLCFPIYQGASPAIGTTYIVRLSQNARNSLLEANAPSASTRRLAGQW